LFFGIVKFGAAWADHGYPDTSEVPANRFTSWGQSVSGLQASLPGPTIVANRPVLKGDFVVGYRPSRPLTFCGGWFEVFLEAVDANGKVLQQNVPHQEYIGEGRAPEEFPFKVGKVYVSASGAGSPTYRIQDNYRSLAVGEYKLHAVITTPPISYGAHSCQPGITLQSQDIDLHVR
jgi:hypothetical protein